MKYIYKDGSYYFFKIKIPYTNKNYSFSLRTKNYNAPHFSDH